MLTLTANALILLELSRWLAREHLGTTAMPIIAAVGTIGLICTMVVVVLLYNYMGLASKSEALGLPDGSVRALLALSLLFLFAILTVFLFNALWQGNLEHRMEGLPAEYSAQTFAQQNPTAQHVLVFPSNDRKSTIVYWESPRDQSGVDFAKTILTLLGTLITAVVSFYFGANSVASATSSMVMTLGAPPSAPARPAPTGAKPDKLNRDSDSANSILPITVIGERLNDIVLAKLVSRDGRNILEGDSPKSNATSVTFGVRISTDLTPGAWDIVLTDKNQISVLVPGGITIIA